MSRTQLPSGFGSIEMKHKEQEGFIVARSTKTIQTLKSETIEIRNDNDITN